MNEAELDSRTPSDVSGHHPNAHPVGNPVPGGAVEHSESTSRTTSPHDPANRVIDKDRNNYPPVQISQIDGQIPLFRGLCQGKFQL